MAILCPSILRQPGRSGMPTVSSKTTYKVRFSEQVLQRPYSVPDDAGMSKRYRKRQTNAPRKAVPALPEYTGEELAFDRCIAWRNALELQCDVSGEAPVSYTHLTLPTIYSV